MKNKIVSVASVLALCLLSGCQELKSAVDRATQEVVTKAQDCGTDLGKLTVGSIFGHDWQYDRAKQMVKGYAKFKKTLNDNHIKLDIRFAPEVAKTCQLSDEAKILNPGSVEVLRYLEMGVDDSILLRGDHFGVDEILILITSASSHPLYDANQRARAVADANGHRVITYYANLGDYESGLSIANVFTQLFR